MKQGVRDDHCFTRYKPILGQSTSLQGGLQTGPRGIAHSEEARGKRREP